MLVNKGAVLPISRVLGGGLVAWSFQLADSLIGSCGAWDGEGWAVRLSGFGFTIWGAIDDHEGGEGRLSLPQEGTKSHEKSPSRDRGWFLDGLFSVPLGWRPDWIPGGVVRVRGRQGRRPVGATAPTKWFAPVGR